MMARNCYQMLGLDLKTPVEFVICWTPQGKGAGGTGQALRIARDLKIPIYDLGLLTDISNIDILNLLRKKIEK
jgi:hypothetical protein